MHGHLGTVFCVGLNPKLVCSGGDDAKIIIWDIESGVRLKTLEGHDCAVVSLQFDDSKIVSGSADKTIKVIDKLKRSGI